MILAAMILAGVMTAVFLVAGLIAGCCRLMTKNGTLSLAAGTLSLPSLIVASLLFWLATMEVDDAPPGTIIIGNLIAVAVIVPIALLASRLTIKFLDRHAGGKGSSPPNMSRSRASAPLRKRAGG